MSPAQTPAPRGARWRARVAARLRSESGDALIEILITAVVVALIAGATLTGYAQVEHLGGLDRHRNEATALAQQDEARLRGLTITELSATGTGTGNTTSSEVVDGTTYTITSTAKFVSGSSSAASCTTGPVTTTADEVETTSSVSWNGDAGTPIAIHGLVTPDEGGSLIVTAVGPSGTTGLAGVTATLSGGPTTVSPLTTDSNGCAVFGGLDGGSYNVAFSDPGYVDVNGNSPPTSQTVTVVPTETAKTTELELGQPGAITAGFKTTYTNGSSTTTEAATDDQFVAVNTGMTAGYRTFGTDSTSTNNSFTSSISTGTSPMTMFPFLTPYVTYAGGCDDNSVPAAGQVSASVTSGNTTSVTLPEPAMIVLPYTASSSWTDENTSSAITYSSGWSVVSNSNDDSGSEDQSSTSGSTATLSFTGNAVNWIGTTGPNEGTATVTLDGTVVSSSVDLYSSSTTHKVTIWSDSNLANTTHTLVIKVNGSHDSSSSGNLVSIDQVNGTTATTLMTTKPDVTVTDTDSGCGNNEDYPPSQVPTATLGALANPGLPYGTYTVCVDNGSSHNTTTMSNTNYTASNYAYVYLYSGASGYTSGRCT